MIRGKDEAGVAQRNGSENIGRRKIQEIQAPYPVDAAALCQRPIASAAIRRASASVSASVWTPGQLRYLDDPAEASGCEIF